MQPISTALASILAGGVIAPQVEIIVQYPNPDNTLQQGEALALDGLIEVQISRNEEPTSDRLDFTVANGDSRYSPLRSA